jgi:hypothetical protein
VGVRKREQTELERKMDEVRGHGWRKWLAAELAVSRIALDKWITGKAPWPAGRPEQVCALLGVEMADYFEEGRNGAEGG